MHGDHPAAALDVAAARYPVGHPEPTAVPPGVALRCSAEATASLSSVHVMRELDPDRAGRMRIATPGPSSRARTVSRAAWNAPAQLLELLVLGHPPPAPQPGRPGRRSEHHRPSWPAIRPVRGRRCAAASSPGPRRRSGSATIARLDPGSRIAVPVTTYSIVPLPRSWSERRRWTPTTASAPTCSASSRQPVERPAPGEVPGVAEHIELAHHRRVPLVGADLHGRAPCRAPRAQPLGVGPRRVHNDRARSAHARVRGVERRQVLPARP